MLRPTDPALVTPEIDVFDDELVSFDLAPEWLARQIGPGARTRAGADDLGLRGLLERPEAQCQAWRRTERARSRGRRQRARRRTAA